MAPLSLIPPVDATMGKKIVMEMWDKGIGREKESGIQSMGTMRRKS